MKAKIFLTGLALFVFFSITSAQKTEDNNKRSDNQSWGPAFVDENKDGICDNLENSKSDWQGQGRNYSRGGRGYGEGRGCRYGRGYGYRGGNGPGWGRGPVRGQGRFYVDRNNNGVCDNFEADSKKE